MAWMFGRKTVETHSRHSASSSSVGGVSWTNGDLPSGRAWRSGERAAVGLREREQRAVEVTELAVHAGEALLALCQAQAVEVGGDIAGEGQPDRDNQCDHERRC
jgi:hypothetical protein